MNEYGPQNEFSKSMNAWWVLNSIKLWDVTSYKVRDQQLYIEENRSNLNDEEALDKLQLVNLNCIRSDLNALWSLLDSANYQLKTITFYFRSVALMIAGYIAWAIVTNL